MRGFKIAVIEVDMKFKALRDQNLIGVPINVVARDEHVPKIERWHRVIKERARCYCAMLPYENLPRMMVIHLMKTAVFSSIPSCGEESVPRHCLHCLL